MNSIIQWCSRLARDKFTHYTFISKNTFVWGHKFTRFSEIRCGFLFHMCRSCVFACMEIFLFSIAYTIDFADETTLVQLALAFLCSLLLLSFFCVAQKRFEQDKIKIYCSIPSLSFLIFVPFDFISSPTSACYVYFYTENARTSELNDIYLCEWPNRFCIMRSLCLHKFAIVLVLFTHLRKGKGIVKSLLFVCKLQIRLSSCSYNWKQTFIKYVLIPITRTLIGIHSYHLRSWNNEKFNLIA